MLGANLSSLNTGIIRVGKKIFELTDPNLYQGKRAVVVGTKGKEKNSLTREVKKINIDEEFNSLIFLHACAKPATNGPAYKGIYNYNDTADLLGWYEVIYEDNYRELFQYGTGSISVN